MISFENVNKKDWRYEMLYPYITGALKHIYYKKIHITGVDNIPKNVPIIGIANHQNGLFDALVMLITFGKKDGRRPIFIARGDMYRKEFVAKLLRLLKIMPAFRKMDGAENLGENEAIFNQGSKVLNENGVVCLFPEGQQQLFHKLNVFRKGFARIGFKAAEANGFEKPIYIMPMAYYYNNYVAMQSEVTVKIGKPFDFMDLYDVYKQHPEKAMKMLADRAHDRVQDLMLDIQDVEHYEEYCTARKIYTPKNLKLQKKKMKYLPNILDSDKELVEKLDKMKNDDRERFDKIMDKTKRYNTLLDKLSLKDWIFRQKLSMPNFWYNFLRTLIVMPFVIYGIIFNLVPYSACLWITRNMKQHWLRSNVHFGAGALAVFPLWYFLLFGLSFIFVPAWWWSFVFLVTLPLSLVVFYRGVGLIERLLNRFRRFQLWFKGDVLYTEAVKVRAEIEKELFN